MVHHYTYRYLCTTIGGSERGELLHDTAGGQVCRGEKLVSYKDMIDI